MWWGGMDARVVAVACKHRPVHLRLCCCTLQLTPMCCKPLASESQHSCSIAHVLYTVLCFQEGYIQRHTSQSTSIEAIRKRFLAVRVHDASWLPAPFMLEVTSCPGLLGLHGRTLPAARCAPVSAAAWPQHAAWGARQRTTVLLAAGCKRGLEQLLQVCVRQPAGGWQAAAAACHGVQPAV